MKMFKKYWLSALFLAFSMICLISFNLIGAYVDEAGLLVESFGFIPLFWFFLFLALVTFFISRFRDKRNDKQ